MARHTLACACMALLAVVVFPHGYARRASPNFGLRTSARPRQRCELRSVLCFVDFGVQGDWQRSPTLAELATLGSHPGDGVWLKHSTSKSDPFGMYFGTTPSFLAYSAHAPRNACRALAGLEVAARVAAADRAATPLFGRRIGLGFTYEQLDLVLRVFLVCGAHVAEADLSKYSVHSFRITLATLLFALKCPIETIKRLLRWRSDDSVLIYGRLSDTESGSWAAKTLAVDVDSRVAPRLITVPIDININVGSGDADARIERDVDAIAAA